MLKRIGPAVLVLVLAGVMYARANAMSATVVTVAEKEYQISMSTTTVSVGTPVQFQVTNDGKIQHEFVVEKAGTVDQHLTADNEGQEVESEIEAFNPGETKTLEWTFTEPGDYQVACHIPGHYEAGMVARFTVMPVGAASANTLNGIGSTAVLVLGLAGGLVVLAGFGFWRVARR